MAIEKPYINCHTHIFTADHVPPYLAKTYIPWPFYYVLHVGIIVSFFRAWYKYIEPFKYQRLYKVGLGIKTSITWILNWAKPLKLILAYYITIQVLFILFDFINTIIPAESSLFTSKMEQARDWLRNHYLLLNITSDTLRVLLVIIVLLFVPSGRNLIFFILKKIWQFLVMLPGSQTKELLRRYLNIGRFAFHRDQHTIMGRLRDQYPPDTGFIILPMDMEHMGAGPEHIPYRVQMERLADMKRNPLYSKIMFPFVFADPRRIRNENDYFRYRVENNKVILEDCFIKRFIVDEKFSGIKIYPALGYFPFDEQLLPMFKYAADEQIPVTTHCIRGTIFYRGKKDWAWNRHPVFNQAMGHDTWPELLLPEMENVDFSINFTHPLNYLCLLEEKLLRIIVGKSSDENVKTLFGFTDSETKLKCDLSHLKICIAHFGGEDEWLRYFEKDRFGHSAALAKYPERGIDFLETDTKESKGKPEQLWKDTDWYSIICSMMLQFPNVYADISYILHGTAEILPLLKQTLRNPGLRPKVLYGTDFYVVRNHKSDKNILADMMGGLEKADFDTIAKENPEIFLSNKVHNNTHA